MEQDTKSTFHYAANGPVVTIDPIASQHCTRFKGFCDALVVHLQSTVGGLCGAFNQSIGVAPRYEFMCPRASLFVFDASVCVYLTKVK